MDRQIVYPGAIPLESDLLNTNKFAMIGLAKLASTIMGGNTFIQGLECTPTSPASMGISICEGQIYSFECIDGFPYSSLKADTQHSILKQGINPEKVSFELSAPLEMGQAINYLIQVGYRDMDTGPTVLPYYNATDPAIAFSGPDNSGIAQKTIRSGVCVISLKAGTVSVNGSQKTPRADDGFIAAWVITLQYGASKIESADIQRAVNAPFLPSDGLVSAIQNGCLTSGRDNGSLNCYRVRYSPPVTSLHDGMRIYFRTLRTNDGASQLKVDEHPLANILTAEGRQLDKATININQMVEVEWNASLNCWILCNQGLGYSKSDADGRYLPLSGGTIAGDLDVEGAFTAKKSLNIGKAEIKGDGDLCGELWRGSLKNWLLSRDTNLSHANGMICWKDPVSNLLIQGGRVNRGDFNHQFYFPVVYPQQCSIVVITQSGKSGLSRDNPHVTDINNAGFIIAAGKGESSFYWVALGE